MTSGLRWRVISLQVVLVVVLAFVAGFLYWGANFTHSSVKDQLSAQKIFFPAAGSPSFSPTEYPSLQQYAGKQLVDGDMAKAFADDYIGHHLKSVDNGKTYSQASTDSRANPNNAAMAAAVQTLFRGETLRGMLLNAYGWWTVGTYALYAAIGLTVAAVAVFLALMYELFMAPKQAGAIR